jgi:hypothetical protein
MMARFAGVSKPRLEIPGLKNEPPRKKEKNMRKTSLLVFLATLCNLTLFAQTAARTRIVHTTERSEIHVPREEVPAGLQTIYSNLGTSATDLYDDSDGYVVLGPNVEGNDGYYYWEAMQFTPATNSRVSQVQVAVQYGGSGANRVNLSIYGSTNGAPGTLLAGPKTVKNLPTFGTCCTLAVAKFSPLAVTGGTQYWVVASTPTEGAGSDSLDLWDFVVQGETPASGFFSSGVGGGWYAEPGLEVPAGEVLGTIP